jgi:hypothetical protein
MLRAEPVTQVLQKVSGIEPGSELSEAVVTCYESLSNGIWPEVSGTRD